MFKAENKSGGFRSCKKLDQANHYAKQFSQTTGIDSIVKYGEQILATYTVRQDGHIIRKDIRTGCESFSGKVLSRVASGS
jgi:hypothetical protein